MLTSEQIRAARAMLRMEQREVSEAAGVSLPTIKRLEKGQGLLKANVSTVEALRRAFETAGVEFIPENGGGAGVRLKFAEPRNFSERNRLKGL